MQIPFNKPALSGDELNNIAAVLKSGLVSGDGEFTHKCHAWFEKETGCQKSLLTTSCTHALEMSAILADIKPGDEVIMPSYTFSSTANAFILRGARIVFVDIRPDTLNLDENLIEAAITPRTRAIVPVHYASVACEMETINNIAARHKLLVIEDAAQGMMASYHKQPLGTIGDFGCYSFHESKNYTCGEGGVLLINRDNYALQAEIIREKGTNRSSFFRGEIDKYSWVDIGSSYLPSEINAAFLLAQLEAARAITARRVERWNYYHRLLEPLEESGLLRRPVVPADIIHNGHIYYILLPDEKRRDRVAQQLKSAGVAACTHYVPLHSAPAGVKYSTTSGELTVTNNTFERLLRLPMFADLTAQEQEYVVENIKP